MEVDALRHPASSSNNACQFSAFFSIGRREQIKSSQIYRIPVGFFSSACLLSFPFSSFASCQVIGLLFYFFGIEGGMDGEKDLYYSYSVDTLFCI